MGRNGCRTVIRIMMALATTSSASVWAAEEAPAPGEPTAEPAAEPAPAAPTTLVPTLAFEKYTLPNGLEVILHEDKRTPQVTVNVWYHVGALHESPGKTGFAHLFEHLMFQGSKHVGPEQHFKLLEEAGATFVNGSTDFDRTDYYQTVPRHELELALWLEADRMGYLMESMTQATLDEQRGVVKNERRQTTEATPYGIARERLWQAVIPPVHPYHGAVIGSQADLDRASFADVRAFYDDYYAPSNATLCITGDFDTATVKTAVDKYFKSLPTWPKPKAVSVTPPVINGDVRIQHDETVGVLPYVELMWLVPGRGQPGEFDLMVLASVLGDGVSSKLQEALMVQSELAESIDVSMDAMGNVGVFRIGAVVRPGINPSDLQETIVSTLGFLQELPIQPDEVARAKKKIENRMVFSLELGPNRADTLQESNHYEGDPGGYARRLASLQAVTDTSVMAALQNWLPRERRGVLLAVPKAPGAPDAAGADGAPADATPGATPAAGTGEKKQ
jgi:predicted Zn-dependent peptidase